MNLKRWLADIQGVIDAIDKPVFLFQPGTRDCGRILTVNRRMAASLVPGESWQERLLTDVLPELTACLINEAALRCLSEPPQTSHRESLVFSLNGYVMEAALSQVASQAHDTQLVLGLVTGVAALGGEEVARQYEKLLLTSQQAIIPDGLLIVDEHRCIKSWNRQFEEIWRVPHGLLAEGREEKVLESVFSHLAEPEQFHAQVEHLYRHPEEAEKGTEIPLKCGRVLERYSKGLINAEGKPWGRIWFFRDITERKQTEWELRESEARFQQIAENLPNVVLWLGSVDEGRVMYVSPSYEHIWGRSVQSLYEQGPESWFDAVHPDDRATVQAWYYAGNFLTQSSMIEFRIVRPDGGVRWIRTRGFPIHNEAGRVYRMVGIGEDITERRETRERLWRLQSELSHLSRLRTATELASGLAHELNQPLAAIATRLHASLHRLKSEGIASESLTEGLEKALSQSLRAGEIVRRLRRFVSKVEPSLEPVDVNDLVREVAGFLTADARQQGVRIQCSLAPELPPALADGIQIQQVLVNLVQNALDGLKELPSENRVREIHIETCQQDAETIEVIVDDTGPGLPASIREELFQPFVSTKPEGTGLGLWISLSIIEVHGGRLTAVDRPEGGARLCFTLPIAAPPATGGSE